jgi:hypothetical protein
VPVDPKRRIPWPLFPDTTLRADGVVPPIVADGLSTRMPSRLLPESSNPLISVPM